ncbi:MAG: hypothetical protein ACRD1Y_01600 [Terriglobales bacterium]
MLSAGILAQGQGLLVFGLPNVQVRAYVQAMRNGALDGPPRALSGPLAGGPPAPGPHSVPLLSATDHKWYLYPYAGGASRLVPWLTTADNPIGWSADGQHLYLRSAHGLTTTVTALDLATAENAPRC